MTADLSRLANSVASARSLFATYAHSWADDRLADLEHRLAVNDVQAVPWVISEVTGSAGSLGDRFICVENGDNIRADETDAVNLKLRQVLETLESDARAIAADLGIVLLR
jgi:hypothetical protein